MERIASNPVTSGCHGFFGPGFWTPLVRYVFHAPQVSVVCFSYSEMHDRAGQERFWRGPKIFGRARSLVRFPPPIRFAPPISRPNLFFFLALFDFRVPSLFCAFFLSLPRILGVLRTEKPLHFSFFQKKQGLEGQGCDLKHVAI